MSIVVTANLFQVYAVSGVQELLQKAARTGVVLHQPLIRRIFVIFGKKGQKMNGVSVSPGQNLQNAPTWQVENTARRRPFSANFWTKVP